MTLNHKNRSTRLPLAITLIAAAFISTFLISTYSNKSSEYWVANVPISPGHQLTASDVSIAHMNLDSSAQFYLGAGVEPIGMIATRILHSGEILGSTDITSAAGAMSTSSVPISVRSVDLAAGLSTGESVDIYWVLDIQKGEDSMDPILILGGVTLLSIDSQGNNFGNDVGISIAVEVTQVMRLLSATTVGRLVVIRSHV